MTACGPKLDDLAAGETGRVAAVQDGDTLTLDSGLKTHLAGIEAPRRGQPLAEEARAALERAAVGRPAELRYGGTRQLANGAALAQVFVKSEGGRTIWLQESLVRDGFAFVHTRKDNTARAARLLSLEEDARRAKRGIWADPAYAVRRADAVGDVDRFMIVEGTVLHVAPQPGRTYLDFGMDYRTDFTVVISDVDLPAFIGPKAPDALVNTPVRVRGFVRERGGPLMRIDHPEQIEVIGRATRGWTLFPPSAEVPAQPLPELRPHQPVGDRVGAPEPTIDDQDQDASN